MIIWKQEYATGIEQLDQQHRMLMANINHLEEMLYITNPTRQDCEFVTHLVDFLESYADTHFKQEESCMSRYRCPAHVQNLRGHDYFRGLIRQYKQDCTAGGFTLELLRKLHESASTWITEHILKIDTQLRNVLPA